MDIYQSGMMAENPVPRGDQGGVLQSPAPFPSLPPQLWEGKIPRPIRGGREREHTHLPSLTACGVSITMISDCLLGVFPGPDIILSTS